MMVDALKGGCFAAAQTLSKNKRPAKMFCAF